MHRYIWYPGVGMEGADLPCRHTTLLNRLCKAVGSFIASMKKWGKQCCMWVWGTWVDCWPHHYHLLTVQTTIGGRPLSSGTRDEGMAACIISSWTSACNTWEKKNIQNPHPPTALLSPLLVCLGLQTNVHRLKYLLSHYLTELILVLGEPVTMSWHCGDENSSNY